MLWKKSINQLVNVSLFLGCVMCLCECSSEVGCFSYARLQSVALCYTLIHSCTLHFAWSVQKHWFESHFTYHRFERSGNVTNAMISVFCNSRANRQCKPGIGWWCHKIDTRYPLTASVLQPHKLKLDTKIVFSVISVMPANSICEFAGVARLLQPYQLRTSYFNWGGKRASLWLWCCTARQETREAESKRQEDE